MDVRSRDEVGQLAGTLNTAIGNMQANVTEMARGGVSEKAFAQRVASMSDRTMVGRVGVPEDIAAAVAFLVDPDAGFVTAQVLTVDGGRMDYIGHG